MDVLELCSYFFEHLVFGISFWISQEGLSALHLAVQKGDMNLVCYLLDKGIKINLTDQVIR